MIRRRLLCALFVVTWCVVVLWQAPASVVLPWLDLPLAAAEVQGSLWRGRAEDVMVDTPVGRVALGRLDWHLEPRSLLSLSLCAGIETALKQQQTAGRVCLERDTTVKVTNFTLAVPVNAYSSHTFVDVRGDLIGAIDELRIQRGGAVLLTGRANWTEAAFNDGSRWVELPVIGLQARSRDGGGIHLRFRDQEDERLVLDVVTEIDRDGTYSTRGELATTPSTPKALHQWLPVIAEADGGGRFRIHWSGGLQLLAER